MKWKIGKMSRLLVSMGLLTLSATLTAQAYPFKGAYCSQCHGLDPDTTWILVDVVGETDTSISYSVGGSDNYNGEEAWAVFDEMGANIANGYYEGLFTLPKDGQTYWVFWVDDSNPSKGGSASKLETTPAVGVPGIALADLVGKAAWPERHHFDRSKDEDGWLTLYGMVRNQGTVATRVMVHFVVFKVRNADTGTPKEPLSLWAVGPEIEPGEFIVLAKIWSEPLVGKYQVFAQCWYDSDGDYIVDTAGQKVKRFPFSVVP